ncbi:MAG: hypothetical protein ACQES9_13850, partial [Myxococcota bacterium]
MNKKKLFFFIIIFTIISNPFSCKKDKEKKKKRIEKSQVKLESKNDEDSKHYELVSTLYLLHQFYYDPTKLKPQIMLIEALQNLQTSVASIAYFKKGKKITLQVDKEKKIFKIGDLNDLGQFKKLSIKIFDFLVKEIKKQGENEEETKELIEDAKYSFINGFLEALDPHSVLIKPKYNDELQMHTKGQYGGVGMVLSIRNHELTVIDPREGGPAL